MLLSLSQSCHEGNCPFLLIECQACRGVIPLNEKERHSERECPERTLNCKYCKSLFYFPDIKVRELYPAHRRPLRDLEVRGGVLGASAAAHRAAVVVRERGAVLALGGCWRPLSQPLSSCRIARPCRVQPMCCAAALLERFVFREGDRSVRSANGFGVVEREGGGVVEADFCPRLFFSCCKQLSHCSWC